MHSSRGPPFVCSDANIGVLFVLKKLFREKMNDLPIFFERFAPYTSAWIEFTTYYLPTIGESNTDVCKKYHLKEIE